MPVADLNLPSRLLAGGGPSTPDPRVLRALTAPIIGQFDPAFTQVMDEVMVLAREVLNTSNVRCFPATGLAPAGLEAVLNTLLDAGDAIAVEGSDAFVDGVMAIARGYGLQHGEAPKLAIVPHLDPLTGAVVAVAERAAAWHQRGVPVLIEATYSLGGMELRTDEWQLDAVVAGVDHCLGAPSGMTLLTYSDSLARGMQARSAPPKTSYLDVLQLQAYWSAERLNHHTAPTSLVYGLHEALRLLQVEGLESAWRRHATVAAMLRDGLPLTVSGDGPVLIVDMPEARQRRLLEQFGIHVQSVGEGRCRVGLLGADAQLSSARSLLAALEQVQ